MTMSSDNTHDDNSKMLTTEVANMSINLEELKEAAEVCACCGIAPVDGIKLLKECNGGCELVKYCSDDCQENHRELHEEDCKKRKAVLHDKELFEQPDGTYLGECPICFLPLSLDMKKSSFYSCCSKIVCLGCVYADHKSSGKNRCPFCREPNLYSEEEDRKRVMERVKAKDPAALRQMGVIRYEEGDDYDKAIEYYTKAAELGDEDAYYGLGTMYYKGEGVEQDEEKAVYHLEVAAIGGHPTARHNLGVIEGRNGNMDRAVKHFIIGANLGDEDSMKALWKHYSAGNITKEDLDATLRTHKAAIDATKSAQREAAEACHQRKATASR